MSDQDSAAERRTRLQAIAEREAKATKGPWFSWMATTDFIGWTIQIAAGWLFKQSDKAGDYDATFIAEARQDIPWLLAQLAEADATAEALRAKLSEANRQRDVADGLIDTMHESARQAEAALAALKGDGR